MSARGRFNILDDKLYPHDRHAKVEVTLESYDDEGGHVRAHPTVGLSEPQIEGLEGKVA